MKLKDISLPLTLLEIIPKDDLNEMYMRTRFASFLKWVVIIFALVFFITYAVRQDWAVPALLSMASVTLYLVLRLTLIVSDISKELSEETRFKIMKYNSLVEEKKLLEDKAKSLLTYKDGYDEYKTKNALLIDDSQRKNALFVEKENNLQKEISKLELKVVELESIEDTIQEERLKAYNLAIEHGKEMDKISRSTNQSNISEAKKKECEDRLAEIEQEKMAMVEA